MNLRWLLGNYADPEFQLSRREQREVTWLAHRKHLSTWKLLLWTAVMTLTSWALLAWGYDPFAGVLAGFGVRQARYWSIGVICLAASVGAAWMYRWLYRTPVRLAMREMGHDICVGCGYRLQGLVDDIKRCPECGREREPTPIADPRS